MHASDVLADLVAEQQDLDSHVDDLDDRSWRLPTASAGWNIADQVAHLTYFDDAATVAIVDPERFQSMVTELFDVAEPGSSAVDDLTLRRFRALPGAELLEAWRDGRAALAAAAAGLSDDDRINWYGPTMGSMSFLTARLMECWAHGQDIIGALGVHRDETDRLRHIVRLGYNTRAWSYRVRGLEPPESPVSLTLMAPSGGIWSLGPSDAADTVEGSAHDFCLVVTQRRHVADTGLTTTPVSREWLEIAQAFAGGPTLGPSPSER